MFNRNRELTEEERKWNLMWDMWVQEEAISPYAELMEYDSEVNNGGHSQYFFNVANCSDLKSAVEKILPILPEPLNENLKKAYDAFSGQEDICDDENDDLFGECDRVFYDNEQCLLDLLKMYAHSMVL